MRSLCMMLAVFTSVATGFTSVYAQSDSDYSFTAGALFLHRSNADAYELFVDGADSEILSSQDYQFDFSPGYQFAAQARLFDDCSIIGGYGNVTWDQGLSGMSTNGIFVDNGSGIVGNAGNVGSDSFISTLDSRYENVFLGLQKDCTDWLSVYGTFQYISVDDQLWGQFANGPVIDGVYRAHTDNDLLGANVGTNISLLEWNGHSLGLRSGFGVFGNDVSTWNYYEGAALNSAYTSNANETSWSYDLAINGSCQVNEFLSIGAGYQLLFVDNLAVATKQAGATDFVAQQGYRSDDSVFFQGLNLFATVIY